MYCRMISSLNVSNHTYLSKSAVKFSCDPNLKKSLPYLFNQLFVVSTFWLIVLRVLPFDICDSASCSSMIVLEIRTKIKI